VGGLFEFVRRCVSRAFISLIMRLAVFSNMQGMMAWIIAAPRCEEQPGCEPASKLHALEIGFPDRAGVIEKGAGNKVDHLMISA